MKNNIKQKMISKKTYFSKIDIAVFVVVFLISFIASQLLFGLSNISSITGNEAFQRIAEKVILFTKLDSVSKATYLLSLLDIRLTEVENIVNNQDYSLFMASSSRYSTTAGNLTDLVIRSKSKVLQRMVLEKFSNHQIILQKLLQKRDAKHEDWKFIEDDVNYLHIYTDKLSKIQLKL